MDGANDGLLFGDGTRKRLFAVDVFFARGLFWSDDGVPVIGDGDHDGVDVVASEECAVIVDGGAVLVAVVAVDSVDGGLQMVLLDVAGGDNLAIVKAQEGLCICRAHHAPADNPDGDALMCRDAARAGKGAGGERSDSSGGLDEFAR